MVRVFHVSFNFLLFIIIFFFVIFLLLRHGYLLLLLLIGIRFLFQIDGCGLLDYLCGSPLNDEISRIRFTWLWLLLVWQRILILIYHEGPLDHLLLRSFMLIKTFNLVISLVFLIFFLRIFFIVVPLLTASWDGLLTLPFPILALLGLRFIKRYIVDFLRNLDWCLIIYLIIVIGDVVGVLYYPSQITRLIILLITCKDLLIRNLLLDKCVFADFLGIVFLEWSKLRTHYTMIDYRRNDWVRKLLLPIQKLIIQVVQRLNLNFNRAHIALASFVWAALFCESDAALFFDLLKVMIRRYDRDWLWKSCLWVISRLVFARAYLTLNNIRKKPRLRILLNLDL